MRFLKLKTVLILVFALLIVVFTLQNTEVITVKLWFWTINTSRALLIVATVAVGIIFGMVLPSLKITRSEKDGETEEKDEKDTEKKETK